MNHHHQPFEIAYRENILKVMPIYIEKQLLYRIQFPDKTPTLVICCAINFEKKNSGLPYRKAGNNWQ